MPEKSINLGLSKQQARQLQAKNLPHCIIVGGMLVSLGGAILTGFKKAGLSHIVFSLSFIGLSTMHHFIHRNQLLHIMKKGLGMQFDSDENIISVK